VILAGDHDRYFLSLARLGKAVLHLKRACDLLAKAPMKGLALALWHRVKDHPHEEPSLSGVLIGIEDVEPRLGKEAADCGDQARAVGAGK